MKQNCADVVSRFYDANLSLARWDQALLAMRDLSAADICFIASHDIEKKSGKILHAVGFQEHMPEAQRKHKDINVLWFSDNKDYRYTDLFSINKNTVNNNNEYKLFRHKNYHSPLGTGDFISLVIRKNKFEILYIMCGRFEATGSFSDRSIEIIHEIAPYICRSFNAGHLNRKHEIFEELSTSIFDAMPMGIALLNYRGQIIATNKGARAVMDEGETFTVSNDGLVFERNGHRVRLVDLIKSLNGDDTETAGAGIVAFSIQRMSGKRPVTITIMKHHHETYDQDIPIATLYIGDPDRSYRFDSAHLCRLYGLSRAEGRVAALIASGYRLEEISDALGIAYETVRKHIKQIFSKTGTSRQAELVRVIITGPSIIPS
jgi:DNA-binding CsgD family transcriptional regulator